MTGIWQSINTMSYQLDSSRSRVGAYDYVLKPLDVPKLKTLIESALKQRATCGRSSATSPC